MNGPTHPPPAIPGHEHVSYVSSGGFGDVFVYRDNIGREVAIKVLHLTGLTDASKAAFQVEAARMARIRNRYVVTVYGFGIADDGRPYISMEYCPDNLADRARRAPLTVPDALRIAVQTSSAVAAAHAEDMFHRDIKPANVLLTHDGIPALTDFGIASGRGAEDQGPRGLSLRYAAPEVISGVSEGEELADTYSIAATTYTILAARAPFDVPGGDNSEAALIARTLEGRPPPTGRSDVPASLERVLARGLALDPAARFASAVDLARALREVEVELGFAATSVPLGAAPTSVVRPDPSTDPEDGTRLRAPRRIDPTGAAGGDAQGPASATTAPPPVAGAPAVPSPGTRAGPPAVVPGPTSSTPAGVGAEDATFLREGRSQPDPRPSDPDPGPTEGGPSERDPRRWAAPVVAAGVLVVVGGGILTLGLAGGAASPPSTDGPSPPPVVRTDQDALFATPSVPAEVEVVQEADGIEVTWRADPMPSVTYVVSVTEGPQAGSSASTDEPRHKLEGGETVGQVCVRVLAVLGGTSSEPSREACTR